MPNDGVNPTARWLARGIWKFMFVLVATLLVFGLVGLVVRAAFGRHLSRRLDLAHMNSPGRRPQRPGSGAQAKAQRSVAG